MSSSSDRDEEEIICCVIEKGKRCDKLACYSPFGKSVEKTIAEKKLNLRTALSAGHYYTCSSHKDKIKNAPLILVNGKQRDEADTKKEPFKKPVGQKVKEEEPKKPVEPKIKKEKGVQPEEQQVRKKKPDEPQPCSSQAPRMDLSVLSFATLKRICKQFGLPWKNKKRQRLVKICTEYLKSVEMDSSNDVLTYFIYMIKTNASRLDPVPLPDASVSAPDSK